MTRITENWTTFNKVDYISKKERSAKLYTDSMLTHPKMYHGIALVSFIKKEVGKGKNEYYISLSIDGVTKTAFLGKVGIKARKDFNYYLRASETRGLVDPREFFISHQYM